MYGVCDVCDVCDVWCDVYFLTKELRNLHLHALPVVCVCVCVCVWLYEHKGAHKTKSGSKSLESYHKLDPNSEAQSLICYMYFQFLDYNRQIDS